MFLPHVYNPYLGASSRTYFNPLKMRKKKSNAQNIKTTQAI